MHTQNAEFQLHTVNGSVKILLALENFSHVSHVPRLRALTQTQAHKHMWGETVSATNNDSYDFVNQNKAEQRYLTFLLCILFHDSCFVSSLHETKWYSLCPIRIAEIGIPACFRVFSIVGIRYTMIVCFSHPDMSCWSVGGICRSLIIHIMISKCICSF